MCIICIQSIYFFHKQTLEYSHILYCSADRAKAIKTAAQVNQTATDKMIQELIAEKEKLLRELQNAKTNKQAGLSDEGISRIRIFILYFDMKHSDIFISIQHVRLTEYEVFIR